MSAGRVIAVAFLADTLVAAMKFLVASVSGSAAMYSEALHSLADATNQLILLFGRVRSRLPPDDLHPFGYGKERFFWPFIVSLLIFSIGSVLSVVRGIEQIRDPHPLSRLHWNFLVFGVAAILDGVSWFVAARSLRSGSPGVSLLRAVRESKSPGVIAVFLQDTAGLVGIAIATVGTAVAGRTGSALADGAASLLIGALLLVVSLVMAAETKSLLIGESASPEVRRRIRSIVDSTPEVLRLHSLLTMQLSPDEILINLDLEFRDGLDTGSIEQTIDRIEHGIRAVIPGSTRIFIEAETPPQPPRTPGA